jgi:O-antigen/teichoic acid export membrane protein
MNQPASEASRHLLVGTARIFAAEALLIPTGILTASYLSRRFGPEGYGLLTLASVLVVLLESNVAMALSRPAIKLVSEAEDWHAVGSAVLRLYMLTGFGLGLTLWAFSTPLAGLMADHELAGYLRLLAIDVPLFCMSQAHRNIIVGLGRFRERALISAIRWIARLVLVVIFVEFSGSLAGAIWGSICASLIELIICRLYVRPRLFQRGPYPVRHLCGYALPLVASALCMSLYSRLDLLLLKPFGATTWEAGIYSVAQNLALLPSLFSIAFAPALLSTLSRALRDGDGSTAKQIGRQAMRATVLLLPAVAIIAGAAPDFIVLIFGPEFLAAAPLLGLLIFAALALLMIAVTTSIMTAAGKPGWTLHAAWPLLVGALMGHFILIPVAGAMGAAMVTTFFAIIGALVTIALVHRLWRIAPSARTLWRCAVVCVSSYMIVAAFPGATWLMLALKLAGAGLFVVVALWLLGEFSAQEISAARAWLRRDVNPVIEASGSAS